MRARKQNNCSLSNFDHEEITLNSPEEDIKRHKARKIKEKEKIKV